MRFTREDESLFLLDEPDTHLNPAWSVQYRRFLDVFGGLGDRSQVLMATHDPLVVSALKREEVRILERGEEGQVHAIRPLEDPQGMGVGNLLTSDVYGLRAQLDIVTLEKIEEKRNLASRPDLSASEEARLTQLATELRNLGFLMEDRDPDFQEYVRAKYSAHDVGRRPIYRNQDEVEAERQLADQLYDELRGESGGAPSEGEHDS
jgi:ABC-type multidrug transport system ATPase subunit